MSHSRQTEHYGLPLYDGTDIINPLTDFNNANETIDEAVYNANQRSVEAENTAGDAKEIAEGYDARVSQAVQTANDAMTLANNTQDMIAEDFDPMKEGGYKVGDFVIYNGKLYRFINAHTGAWDASDVQVSPVLIDAIADVVDEGKQAIEDAVEEAEQEIAGQTEKVTKTQAMIAQPFNENKVGGYAVDDVVTYADKLYKFTSAHSGAWTGLDVEQVDVEEEIAGQTEKVTKTQAMIAQPFDENKDGGYAIDDVVTYADKLYKFTSAHSGAWTGLDVEQIDVVENTENAISGALEWKEFDTSITTRGVLLPSANEYLFVGSDTTSAPSHLTLHVPKISLSAGMEYYFNGFYFDNTHNGGLSIEFTKNSVGYSAALMELKMNGTSITTTGKCKLYYR